MHVTDYRTFTARGPCACAAKAPAGKNTLVWELLVPADEQCCDHQHKGAFSALYRAKELIARAPIRAIHAAAAEWPSGDSGSMFADLLDNGEGREGGGVQDGAN